MGLTVLRLGWNPRASTPRVGSALQGPGEKKQADERRITKYHERRSPAPDEGGALRLAILELEQLVIDAALRQERLVGARLAQRPRCRTRILSMSWIVDSRCAIAIVVRPAISLCSASRISSSVSVSTLDVASSSTRMRGSKASARANDSSCFWPTDSVAPRSATGLA